MSEPDQTDPSAGIVVIPPSDSAATRAIAFEAFGVPVSISASRPELFEAVKSVLPPVWRPCAPEAAEQRFTIFGDHRGTFGIAREGKGIARSVSLDLALEVLDSQLRLHIAENSPDAIFVHAGVVAHRGRTLVLPGPSFAGKTTLVAALVRAGATYFSDEFALVDDRGLVHPYAKPLSIRGEDLRQTDHHVHALGGTAGDEALPVGAIAITRFRADADWAPRRLTPGEGVLAMLANTVPAQSRPAESMRALTRAVAAASVLESDRAEAEAVVPLLLAELERA